MKFKILLFGLLLSAACATGPNRTTASENHCENSFKNALQADLTDEIISSCFDEALAQGKSIGFAQTVGQVSNSDKKSIANYINIWAYLINTALRTNDSNYIRKNQSKLNQLDRSLEQFPIYRGVVFRGSEFPPNEKLEKNISFPDLAFLSTSQDIYFFPVAVILKFLI